MVSETVMTLFSSSNPAQPQQQRIKTPGPAGWYRVGRDPGPGVCAMDIDYDI